MYIILCTSSQGMPSWENLNLFVPELFFELWQDPTLPGLSSPEFLSWSSWSKKAQKSCPSQ